MMYILQTNRTASNCLWRYRRRPGQDRLVWSEEDDAKLKEAVGLFGENWQSGAKISTFFTSSPLTPYLRSQSRGSSDATRTSASTAGQSRFAR